MHSSFFANARENVRHKIHGAFIFRPLSESFIKIVRQTWRERYFFILTADFFRTLFWTSKSAKTIHNQSVVMVGSKKFRHLVPIRQGSLKAPFPSWGTGRQDCKIRIVSYPFSGKNDRWARACTKLNDAFKTRSLSMNNGGFRTFRFNIKNKITNFTQLSNVSRTVVLIGDNVNK